MAEHYMTGTIIWWCGLISWVGIVAGFIMVRSIRKWRNWMSSDPDEHPFFFEAVGEGIRYDGPSLRALIKSREDAIKVFPYGLPTWIDEDTCYWKTDQEGNYRGVTRTDDGIFTADLTEQDFKWQELHEDFPEIGGLQATIILGDSLDKLAIEMEATMTRVLSPVSHAMMESEIPSLANVVFPVTEQTHEDVHIVHKNQLKTVVSERGLCEEIHLEFSPESVQTSIQVTQEDAEYLRTLHESEPHADVARAQVLDLTHMGTIGEKNNGSQNS